ncbi:MAG TPA: S41 family peptidase [Gemmatimonadales bacterium]|nr:S41 family peptidase [Gemmatimonadales bacterium]
MTRRILRVLALVFLAVLVTGMALTVRTPARGARWLAEYDSTRRYLATNDANFDWVVKKKGIDLPALDRETRQKVESAWTSMGAAWAVRSFVWEFGDGHTWARIRPNIWWRGFAGGETASSRGGEEDEVETAPALVQGLGASEACAVAWLDVNARPDGWTLPWPDAPGAELLPDDEFPAVLVPLPDGRKVGVLRIANFGHEHYGPTCARAWERVRARYTAPCPGECRWQLVAATMHDGAIRAAEVANTLAARGAVAVVVDITGNGGGSEFADAIARALTSVPLRFAPGGFVRGPHHVAALQERRDAILADTARATAAQRPILRSALATIDSLLGEAARECGRDPVWSGGTPRCSNVVVATPLVPYAPPGTFAGLENGWAVYGPSWYDAAEGIYRGPLLILQDHRSGSASEEFAARLRDNDAARIVGERSFGAGCGYTNGGTRLELEALGLLVRAPDCQRLRMDGTNETEGIAADVDAGWTADDAPAARLAKAVTAIGTALRP